MTKRVRLIGIVLGVLSLTLLLLWPLNGGPFADATTRQVMMMGNAFSQATLTINVGDRVTWVNHDQVPHDATTTNAPASFRSPMMEQGDTWMHEFTKPGTYEYYCSIHPSMRAKIIVKAAAEPEPKPEPSEPRTSAPKPPPEPEPRTTSKAPAPRPEEDDEPEPDVPDEPRAPATGGKKSTTTAATATRPATAPPTARAAPVAAPAAPAATPSAQPVAAVTTPITTLNPLLLVAGLVTAVLVFTLLVLSSRPQ
jgi:plastocyanin